MTVEDVVNKIDLEKLPNEITTLRELQYLYGAIELAEKGLDAGYAPFLSEFSNAGETGSLLIVDLEYQDGSLIFKKISTQVYEDKPDFVEKIAFSKYDARRGKDHSIVQKSPKKLDSSKLASYAVDMLEWVEEEAVQEYMQNNDTPILNAFDQLSGKQKTAVNHIVSTKISKPTHCLVTPRIFIKGEPKYPGEIEELIEAMKERNVQKKINKTSFEYDSIGSGVSRLTEKQSERLIGVPDDPFKFYKTKQQSTFDNLYGDESSWATQHISLQESLQINKSESVINKLYFSVFTNRVYFLPRPVGKMTNKKLGMLVSTLRILRGIETSSINNSNESNIDYDEKLIKWLTDLLKTTRNTLMSFYIIGMKYDDLKNDISQEFPIVELPVFVDYRNVYKSKYDNLKSFKPKLFDDTNYLYAVFERNMNQTEIDKNTYYQIINGAPIFSAFDVLKEDEYNETDPRAKAYWAMISKDSIPDETLFDQYMKRNKNTHSESMSSMSASLQQRLFHQLILLETFREYRNTKKHKYNNNHTTTMDSDNPSLRRIDDAIANSESIKEDSAARYCFTVGAFVGYLSEEQEESQELNSTIITDHPINRLTSSRIYDIVSDAIDKADTYDMYGTHEFGSRLQKEEVTQEELETEQNAKLQFYYALGISIGKDAFYAKSAS